MGFIFSKIFIDEPESDTKKEVLDTNKENRKIIAEYLGVKESDIREFLKVYLNFKKHSELILNFIKDPNSEEQKTLFYYILSKSTKPERLKFIKELSVPRDTKTTNKEVWSIEYRVTVKWFISVRFPNIVNKVNIPVKISDQVMYEIQDFYEAEQDNLLKRSLKEQHSELLEKNEKEFVEKLLKGEINIDSNKKISQERIDNKIYLKYENVDLKMDKVSLVSKGEPMGVCFKECFSQNYADCKFIYSKNDSTCYKANSGSIYENSDEYYLLNTNQDNAFYAYYA